MERHVKRLYRQDEFGIPEGLNNSHHHVRDLGRAGRSRPYLEIYRCGVSHWRIINS